MRVIAGTARSTPLKAPEGKETRPTTDKIKETLFNILQFDIPGCVFLDIFSGSGGIGIEALSRGAERAVFVDASASAISIIKYNIGKCHFEDRAKVVKTDASRVSVWLPKLSEEDRLVIFLDPPYSKGLEFPVLQELLSIGAIREDTIIIVEEELHEDLSKLEEMGLAITRTKEYKNQKHVFWKRGSLNERYCLDLSRKL